MIPGAIANAQETGRDAYWDQSRQPMPAPAATSAAPGHTADVGTGQIGQRQTREEAAPNIKPMNRINGRIANRVQTRIRNRIDRYYDPRANATSPFRVTDY